MTAYEAYHKSKKEVHLRGEGRLGDSQRGKLPSPGPAQPAGRGESGYRRHLNSGLNTEFKNATHFSRLALQCPADRVRAAVR
jgi:hypothetical protein